MSRDEDREETVQMRMRGSGMQGDGAYVEYSKLKRPSKPGSVHLLKEAENWRRQVLSEARTLEGRLHDPSLDDELLRELNEKLLELLKELGRWDWHIQNRLGGGRRRRDNTVRAVGTGLVVMGKRYYGRAQQLPEVKELQEQQRLQRQEQLVNEKVLDVKRVPKNCNSPYYTGFKLNDQEQSQYAKNVDELTHALQERNNIELIKSPKVKTDYEVPTLKQVEEWLVAKRKQKLLDELEL